MCTARQKPKQLPVLEGRRVHGLRFPEVKNSIADGSEALAQAVLDTRASHADRTLAWLYVESRMPDSRRLAHSQPPARVDNSYREKGFASSNERVAHLLELHIASEAGLLDDA